MQVRYQAALRPDTSRHYSSGSENYQAFTPIRSEPSVADPELRKSRRLRVAGCLVRQARSTCNVAAISARSSFWAMAVTTPR